MGSAPALAQRTAFPTFSGDFVWSLAEESKQVRDDLEQPKEGPNMKKSKEKKDKKGKRLGIERADFCSMDCLFCYHLLVPGPL